MDDTTFHIPNQPNNDDNQDDRPEGADQAADVARAKLNAIYNDQQPATQNQTQPPPTQTPQQQPTTPDNQSQPYQQTPQSYQPQHPPATDTPQQHAARQTHQDLEHQPTAFEDSTDPQSEQYSSPPAPPTQPTPHQPQPTSGSAAATEPTVESQPQPQFAQPTTDQQPHQPEHTTTPQQPQPNIIQPTPAQTPGDDAPVFTPPGPDQAAQQQPATEYVPTQQYAREVSLEDQIDNLHHTAPDHQLPIQAQKKVKKSLIPYNLQPLLRTLALAAVIAIIYNHQFLVGQVQSYINPAQSVVSPTIIAPDRSENVSDQNKLIIPKINVDIPVVYDVTTFDESEVQAGLERGVVHYGTTALPGENGNNVIVGHSSNNFWNNGDYKFAFVLLNKLSEGDTFTLHYGGTAYTYEVFRSKIVPPTAVDVIFEDFGEPVVTLITCDPPGTAWNRLVVNARQISPDPDSATAPQQQTGQPDEVISVPSDSRSLLDNLFN